MKHISEILEEMNVGAPTAEEYDEAYAADMADDERDEDDPGLPLGWEYTPVIEP